MSKQFAVELTEAQAAVVDTLQAKGYPAIRRGAFSDELVIYDHTGGVITEHFVWADGIVESFLLYETPEDWRELKDTWIDANRDDLHDHLLYPESE